MNATAPRFDALLERLRDAHAALPNKPEETPATTLRALWHAAADAPLSATAAQAAGLPALDTAAARRLDDLLARRLRGEPLAHLTGRQCFLGLELLAGPAALVPRRETELLALQAIAIATSIAASRMAASRTASTEAAGDAVLAIDACTGSGNIALALADRVPGARVHGADLSADAVALARANADRLGLAARVAFRTGDLLAPFAEDGFAARVDLLTCNPPYISSERVARMPAEIADHEPRLAFDGGPLGVGLLMRLTRDAPGLLRSGGWLAFEVGVGQGAALARRLRRCPDWRDVRAVEDAHGDVRVLLAQRA